MYDKKMERGRIQKIRCKTDQKESRQYELERLVGWIRKIYSMKNYKNVSGRNTDL